MMAGTQDTTTRTKKDGVIMANAAQLQKPLTIAELETLPATSTAIQAAALFQTTPANIERWARAGKLPGRKLGCRWLFPTTELLKMAGIE